MSSPKSLITRKAAKAVVAHSAHGSISKVKRRPVRSGLLLTVGGALGAAVGFLLGRRTAPPSDTANAAGAGQATSAGAPRPVAAVPDEAARAAGSAASTT
jgi:hypothetical protein